MKTSGKYALLKLDEISAWEGVKMKRREYLKSAEPVLKALELLDRMDLIEWRDELSPSESQLTDLRVELERTKEERNRLGKYKSSSDAWQKKCEGLEEKLRVAEAHVERLQLRNLHNAIKSICKVCGHTETEDGCAYCIKTTSNPIAERAVEFFRVHLSKYENQIVFNPYIQDELRAILSQLQEKTDKEGRI